jgi:hypothetical protein
VNYVVGDPLDMSGWTAVLRQRHGEARVIHTFDAVDEIPDSRGSPVEGRAGSFTSDPLREFHSSHKVMFAAPVTLNSLVDPRVACAMGVVRYDR